MIYFWLSVSLDFYTIELIIIIFYFIMLNIFILEMLMISKIIILLIFLAKRLPKNESGGGPAGRGHGGVNIIDDQAQNTKNSCCSK